MKKLAVLLALTLTVSMFAAGCGDKEEAPAAAPSETPANSEEVQASATPASDKETAAPASDAAAGTGSSEKAWHGICASADRLGFQRYGAGCRHDYLYLERFHYERTGRELCMDRSLPE